MSGFVKMIRSETATDLHQYPKANHLLNVIAQRASRSDRPLKGIMKGEALISHSGCGLTEQEYRTAKKMLTRWQLCDFRVTDKKTYAKLTNTMVYDLNLDEVNGQVTDVQRTANGQVTTNKEDKKERKKEDSKKTKAKKATPLKQDWVLPEDYRQFVKEDKLCQDDIAISKVAENFKDHWLMNGKAFKDWKACWRKWCRSEYTKWPNKPEDNIQDMIDRVTTKMEAAQ